MSGKNINTITTAVPFLLISPDSRSGAMGDAGVAIKPDANSTYWNPAKLAFIDDSKDMGFSMSYSPWLRALVNDINLAYITGYKKLDRNSAVGVSLRYFSLGSITFTDNFGGVIRDFKPNEFSLDACYSRKLSNNFGAGLTARYIYSNLTGGTNVGGADTKPGQSVSTDLSVYYITNEFKIADKKEARQIKSKKGKVSLVKFIANCIFSLSSLKPGAIIFTNPGMKISIKMVVNKRKKTNKLKTELANSLALSFPLISSLE